MSAKIIALGKRARSASGPPAEVLTVERAGGSVFLTAGELQLTLTPDQAKQLGEHLMVLAVVLGVES